MPGILAEIAGRISTLLAFDGDDFRNVLCDSAGHLQIDVLSTVMDVAAATAANQATIITAVQSLQNLVGALHDVDVDELDVNVDYSVLPEGATTETTLGLVKDRLGALSGPVSGSANAQLADIVARIGALLNPAGGSTNKLLTDALTALQLIDDLYGALHSQNTDELVVRGEDQLFSIDQVVAETRSAAVSGVDGFVDSVAVPGGSYWVITTIAAYDVTRDVTDTQYVIHHGGVDYFLGVNYGLVAGENLIGWSGQTFLGAGDTIRVYFIGALTGDTCRVDVTGYRITLEV